MQFYTYSHQTADTGKIFYIGKGSGRSRFKQKTCRNVYWNRIVKKHGFTAEILAYWNTNEEACEHEKLLIASFKDMGYPLANLTEGGEGALGHKHSKEFKTKRSKQMMGNTYANGVVKSEQHKKAQSEMMMGNTYAKGKKQSAALIQKLADRMKGNKFASRKHSDEEKLAQSIRSKGKPWTEARRQAQNKLNENRIYKPMSEETKVKISLSNTGKPSPFKGVPNSQRNNKCQKS